MEVTECTRATPHDGPCNGAPHICDDGYACYEPRHAFQTKIRERIAWTCAITKLDLLQKFEAGDWHGVMDAAADLRDREAELRGIEMAK